MGRKPVIITIVIILLILLTGSGTFIWFKNRSLPKTSGKIIVRAIKSPVEIIRDSDGVPHIYAENREDLFFAQGFVHSQDRFWQMEFSRRIGSGRLSELFGSNQLEADIFLRTMGFESICAEEFATLEPEYQNYLNAYSAGVNSWISSRKPQKLALEFSLLKMTGVKIDIEPWTPINTLTWAKVMAIDLNGNMFAEKLMFDVIRSIGYKNSEGYFSPFLDDIPFIVSKDEYISFCEQRGMDITIVDRKESIFTINPVSQSSLGSNNWVISGEKTETGKPILANDMHLGIQMPSIWYEVDLNCSGDRPFHVKGFSFAGTPGVVVGHNDYLGWGVTNLMMDVQDMYVEKLNTENPDMYLKNGMWEPMHIKYETINIHKEEEPYILRVRSTGNGPLISDFGYYKDLRGFTVDTIGTFPENTDLNAISLKWTALSPGYIIKAIIDMNEAENYEQFRDALYYWDSPGQNFVYADKLGNIAYQMTGKAPIRREGTGVGPMPGWVDDYLWKGYIPFDEMPASFNPEKGYIVTANNAVIDSYYPYYLSAAYVYGYRAKRISELIESGGEKISIEDVKSFHSDVLNFTALETISSLKKINLEDLIEGLDVGKDQKLIEESYSALLEWDGMQLRTGIETTIYTLFWHKLVELIFKDQFPEDQWPPKSLVRFENSVNYLLNHQNNIWWDNRDTPDKVETADEIIIEAFTEAILKGAEELGYKIKKWEWGKVHTAEFRNQTLGESGISIIENLFNRGPFPVDGGASQVNVTAWEFDDPFNVYHIASMRQILDLADFSNSLMIHPTGQSGHPASRHYDDFIPLWQNIDYHSNLWIKDDVLKKKEAILELIPQED